MGNFALQHILPCSETDLSKGIYIILFDAGKIPPHLLLSVNEKIYSITDSGRQMGSPLEKFLGFIKRKNIATLFAEIKAQGNGNGSVREHFLKYDKVVEGKVSCLFPIRDVMAEIFGSEMNKAGFIFDLLPMIEKENGLGKIFQLNMENKITDGKFELLTYTQAQMKAAQNPENKLP